MAYNIDEYLQNVNRINEEIKAIKSADCIIDYDAKTQIIDMKKRAIAGLTSLHNTIITSGMELDFSIAGENDEELLRW